MTIGSNFELITNLQYKLRSLAARVQAYESGQKYTSMCQEFKRQLAAQERNIANLKKELAGAYRGTVTMRMNWMQVYEDLSKEHDKALCQKDRRIKDLEERLLATQQQLDDARHKLKDKQVELYQVKTELEESQGANLQLKAQINRDYENSSIPSSQKPNARKITNNREKTGRKPGGQPGHAGHHRKRHVPTTRVHIPAPDEYVHSDGYTPTGRTICKQMVNIGITVHVDEYDTPEFRNVRTGQRVHAGFPPGVVNDINYGGSIKAAAFLLNNRCGVSIDKVREFLSDMTEGQLQISKGMINGLSKEFSTKTEAERKKAYADLQLTPVMNVDFTSARVNGKNVQVAICATPDNALYFARNHKGHKGIAGTPVEDYRGILVHDHDITFYHYGDAHQECLVHVLRYLKDSMDNEPTLQWNWKMRALLQEMIHYRKGLSTQSTVLDSSKVKAFETRYKEILELAKEEYEYEPPTRYYRNGYNLYARLDKYTDSHLLFLHDGRVPTNNNLCERKGRAFKRKLKQVMAFRSFESLAYLCNSMSGIDLLSAREVNLFKSVAAILD